MALDNDAQQLASYLENILVQLQDPNNDVRSDAEKKFEQTKQHASACLKALVVLPHSSQNPVVKISAPVLLRRNGVELWNGSDEDSRKAAKENLFNVLRLEMNNKSIRKKICDTLTFLSCNCGTVNDQPWPELLPFLFQLMQGSNEVEKLCGLEILCQLVEYVSSTWIEPQLPAFHNIFHGALSSGQPQLQAVALRATCGVLTTIESSLCSHFQDLAPLMLQTVNTLITQGQLEETENCLQSLVEVADSEPKYFRRVIAQYCEFLTKLAAQVNMEEDIRQEALEFLVAICEKMPNVSKKTRNFVPELVRVALSMMLELEDDPEWYTVDDEDEDDSGFSSNFDAGQEALDRIALSLGGKTLLPIAFQILPHFLANQESWVHRHAAILAISQIGEGCRDQMYEQLEAVVDMVLQRLQDPHPRVRWAAINCIGQMCTDFAPWMQQRLHQKIIPGLESLMNDTANPRVQAHAAAAIINFCEDASPDIVSPYLDGLLRKLLELLASNRRIVQEQAVSAIAAVADSAEQYFIRYYDSFMPLLKNILYSTEGQKPLRRLRGKVIECISLIGVAVGRDKFGGDAAEVMDLLVRTQSAQLEPDDPQAAYLMQAYARICRCLREAFVPYLPYVMPALLSAAKIKPDIEVADALEDSEEDSDNDGELDTFRVGDKRIGIKTSMLEDKATACGMIACFASELRGYFYDYVEEVTKIMVPLLKFLFHEDVRSAAASCLPDLLRSVNDKFRADEQSRRAVVQGLVDYMLPKLLEAIELEPEPDVLDVMIDSLGECCLLANFPILSEKTMTRICLLLKNVLQDRKSRLEDLGDEDEEEEEGGLDEEDTSHAKDEAREKEDTLLDSVIDCVASLIKTHTSVGFIKALETPLESEGTSPVSLLTVFGEMLSYHQVEAVERKAAICVFDDIIEWGGEEGRKYIRQILPALDAFVTDKDANVRQSAAYGLGLCAQFGGTDFASFASSVGQKLVNYLSWRGAYTSENMNATENVVSALMKIVEYQRPMCDVSSFIDPILNNLPLKQDESEALIAHELFSIWLERRDVMILGQHYERLLQVLRITLQIVGTSLLSDTSNCRLVNFIKSLRNESTDLQQNVLTQLDQGLQQKLYGIWNES
ncbi:hypothetical protein GAYE_SCF54G6238 [Galdieria yellowstonensis]|uniref:Importin N-terminal domain-containing protein n=1 Tax=Galdieria yellowstonensis TaxID=3028027 RepID=A0AAV9IME0_9RHOD|nr:hypothetical protein GAYE_SCF54G6238 [Galdieria yellowstonensis]